MEIKDVTRTIMFGNYTNDELTVEQLIEQCRKARQDFKAQDKKMRKPTNMGSFNWRCVPKTDRLHKTWKHLEARLLKEVYK